VDHARYVHVCERNSKVPVINAGLSSDETGLPSTFHSLGDLRFAEALTVMSKMLSANQFAIADTLSVLRAHRPSSILS